MSLNVINRFVVRKLVTFDSGDETPDIPKTFNYTRDAALLLRCKNVALIFKKRKSETILGHFLKVTYYIFHSFSPLTKVLEFYIYPYSTRIPLKTDSRASSLF